MTTSSLEFEPTTKLNPIGFELASKWKHHILVDLFTTSRSNADQTSDEDNPSTTDDSASDSSCGSTLATTSSSTSPTYSHYVHRPASNEPAPKNPTKTLFVGNLAVEVSEGMLMDLFSRYGNVTECCKRWYHYAFIQYSTEEQAHDALIALDGHRISGRAMRVEFQRKKIRAIERMNDDVGLCLTGHHLLENKSPTNSISGYPFQHHHHCSGSHGGNCSHVNSGIPSPLDGRQRKTPDPPRSIYISMEDTDSYFSKPGEQVAICTDFKLYELFPRNACYENDILDSYYGNRTSKKMTSVDFNFLHAATLRKVVVQNVPASVSMSIGNKI